MIDGECRRKYYGMGMVEPSTYEWLRWIDPCCEGNVKVESILTALG